VIILGTGLIECIMSGLMSVDGKKVLHMDKNDYYGGAAASLTLDQFFKRFNAAKSGDNLPAALGSARDYNIDLIPKFVMAKGGLVKILLHTRTTHYLDFAKVDSSYVNAKGRVAKVPVTAAEALASPLMGMFEKRRMKKLLDYIIQYDPDDAATHDGRDLKTMPMSELYEFYSLDDGTQMFMGHATALHRDDAYLTKPAESTVLRMKLYAESLMMYGDTPFIYPLYGLGDLPQAFARLSAVYGGTFMLDTPFNGVNAGADGKPVGINTVIDGKDAVLSGKAIFASPDYFPEKCQEVGKVVRCYCILDHPPAGIPGQEASGQLIIPGNEVGRKSDVYVLWMGDSHKVAAEGKWIALVSTNAEKPDPEQDIAPGLALIGPTLEKYTAIDPLLVPNGDGSDDGIFLSRSYDSTTHFETTVVNCMELYKQYAGVDLVLTNPEQADA